MIAPLRSTNERPKRRRRAPGLERAHRWIADTLFTETQQAKLPRPHSSHELLVVAWIVVVTSVYYGRLAFDRLTEIFSR